MLFVLTHLIPITVAVQQDIKETAIRVKVFILVYYNIMHNMYNLYIIYE